jgi:2-dehydro-3-deoxyphosphogluconate aldolase/(4S)-4-hydroxy-2-oxoglutarate aldolase
MTRINAGYIQDSSAAEVLTDLVHRGPVIPVVIIPHLQHALPLAGALREGGMRTIEVTLRTDCALEAIGLISRAYPDLLVGAGTLRRPDDARAVREAGAAFAVSPGYLEALDEACTRERLPLLPGVSSPTEILQATRKGSRMLKLFPAEAVGGIPLLKALASPFPDIKFCPTGGISAALAPEYLAQSNVACVGGSWMLPATLVNQSAWDQIASLAHQAQALQRP